MIKEELTKLLMEAYERGQSDLIKSCQETVSIAIDTAILAEREACAKLCEDLYSNLLDDKDIQKHWPERIRTNKIYATAIRARGQA